MKVFLSDVVNCYSHDSNQRRHRSKASAWTACLIVFYRYLNGFIRSYSLSGLGVDILESEFCMGYWLIGWPRSPRSSSVYLSRHKDSSDSAFKTLIFATTQLLGSWLFSLLHKTICTTPIIHSWSCEVIITWGAAVNLSGFQCSELSSINAGVIVEA